jgi:hypothetical protein
VNGRSKPKFNGARNARDYLTIIQFFAVARGVTNDVLEARHVGGDSRWWGGDGSDNDHGECRSGEE